jgi:hypothetical protein
MATEKQVNYILYLLAKAGYSTKWMNASFKDFGCTQRERRGKVSDWVSNLNSVEASNVITKLKAKVQ